MSDTLPTGAMAWIAGARPRTLPAAVVPVLVGTAAASGVDGPLIAWRAVAAGLALAAAVGWELVAVGAVSIAAGWFYTGGTRPYGYLGLGEVFVFVFFGLVATVGSTYVQLGEITGLSVLASIPVGLLATALLVTNNLRDIPGDAVAGKQTLAVRLGDRRTRYVYVGMLALAFAMLVPIAVERTTVAGAVVAAILAMGPVKQVLEGASGPALIPVLAATGQLQLAFGLLLTSGLFLSS